MYIYICNFYKNFYFHSFGFLCILSKLTILSCILYFHRPFYFSSSIPSRPISLIHTLNCFISGIIILLICNLGNIIHVRTKVRSRFVVTRIFFFFFLHFIHSSFVYLCAIVCNKKSRCYLKL